MSGSDNTDPIEDDEILYRRIPASQGWYDGTELSPEAFRPTENDTTGLSVVRGKYTPIEEAAKGRPGKSYYVALLQAGGLREAGIEVVSRPTANDCAHAELPQLTFELRKSPQVREWKILLAHELTIRVEGPFTQSAEQANHG